MHAPGFIANGIAFTCTDCGRCCSGAPGSVALAPSEFKELAAFLRLSSARLLETGVVPHDDGYRILEKPNGDCQFFNGRCTIYPVRPLQCRTYPFWRKNLRSEEAWGRTCAECPGIGQGRHYTAAEILEELARSLAHVPDGFTVADPSG
jgi:uncharacterized protein